MRKSSSPATERQPDEDSELLTMLISAESAKQKLLDKHQKNERVSKERALIFGALLLFCYSAVIQLSTLSKPTEALQIAVKCFSIAIPFLCVAAIFENWQRLYRGYCYFHPKYPFATFFLMAGIFGGVPAALIGIGAIFFHFSFMSGALFAIITFIVLIFHTMWRAAIEKLNTSLT
jgi:hypothetical protein